MEAVRHGIVLVLSLLLAGCYVTEFPIVERGEYIAFKDKYSCKNQLTGKTTHTTVSYRVTGTIFKDYTYTMSGLGDGNVKFAQINGKKYLMEVEGAADKGLRYNLLFLEQLKSDAFFVSSVDITKEPYIRELGNEHNISFHNVKDSKAALIGLRGSAEDIKTFLFAHDRSLTTPILRCQPTEDARNAEAETTFDDPIAYCQAVDTADGGVGGRYTGVEVPKWIAQAIGVDPAEASLERLVRWRCYRGDVLACREGGSHPLCETMDDGKVAAPHMFEFCKENPNERSLPGYVVGT